MTESASAMLADAVTFELDGTVPGDRFQISVAVLGGPEPGPYPTVYMSDANGGFAGVVQLAGFLRLLGEVSPLVLVGIGYPLEGFFTSPMALGEWARLRREHSVPASVQAGVGRIADMLEFYENTLVPYIEANFPAGPARALFGMSATGAFAVQAWMMRPGIFPLCAALAPAVGTPANSPLPSLESHIASLEPAFLAERTRECRLFISFGTKERVVSVDAGQRLHARLVDAGVNSTLMMLEDETHATSWAAGAAHALRGFFPGPNAIA